MKKVILAALFLLPAFAMGAEPANGTLIQVSSISGFVLFSSLWALWAEHKRK